jgi:hypothetical protein
MVGEAAINWPEAPRFVDRTPMAAYGVAGVCFVGGGLFLLFILFSAFRTDAPIQPRDFLVLAVAGSLAVALLGYGLFFLWVGLPSFAITDDGVFAFRRGKPWRAIAWREVASITRSYIRPRGVPKPVPVLAIKGPRFALRIWTNLEGYDEALRLLTRYARDHGIKLRQIRDNTTSEISEL